jgi:hypothetical protein
LFGRSKVRQTTDMPSHLAQHGDFHSEESTMQLFIRSVTVKHAASAAAAMQFAASVCAYVNKTYQVKMKCGMEAYGRLRIHWLLDMDSFDAAMAMNQKILSDPEYMALLNNGKDLWVEGSLKDRLIRVLG